MKKLFFFIFILSCFAIYAQTNVEFGAKAGLNKGILLRLEDRQKSETKIGFQVGGFAQIPMAEKLYLQPELLYSLGFVEYTENRFGGQRHVEGTGHTLSLPIMLKYEVLPKFKLGFGPQIAYLLHGDYDATFTGLGVEVEPDFDYRDEINSWEISLGGDIQYDFSEKFFADFRYNYGLTKVRKLEASDAKASALQLSVGYKF